MYGILAYGASEWGGSAVEGANGNVVYLFSTNPLHADTGVALTAPLSFSLAIISDTGALIDPFSIRVLVGPDTAVIGGGFMPGWDGVIEGGYDSKAGELQNVSITTHPNYYLRQEDVVISVMDTDGQEYVLSFSFFTAAGTISNLVAKTWCEGRRIDLACTLPTGTQNVRVRRHRYAFPFFEEDPGEVIFYEFWDTPEFKFIDGVDTYLTNNGYSTEAPLDENQFYYYTVDFSLIDPATTASFITTHEGQVSGLSIKDYNTAEGRYVYAELPRTYRRRDALPGPDQYKTRDYCDLIQCSVNLRRGFAEALLLFRDPERMPAGRVGEASNQTGILEAAVSDFGVSMNLSFDTSTMRRVIEGIIPSVWKKKGTCPGFEGLARVFAKWNVRCDEGNQPVCGFNRVFQTWDGESWITHTDAAFGEYTVTEGSFTVLQTEVLDWQEAAFALPLTADGLDTVSAVVDHFGTFACVDVVAAGGGSYTITFTNPRAYLRPELLATMSVVSGTDIDITSFDYESWPWQFPGEAPRIAANAFVGMEVIDSSSVKRVVVSNLTTDDLGVTRVVLDGAVTGTRLAICSKFSGLATWASRQPHLAFKLYSGRFSLTWNPKWDIRLKDDTIASPWSLVMAGKSLATGGSIGVSDIVLWVQDVHLVVGRVTDVAAGWLEDNTKDWAVDRWRNKYVIPNWTYKRALKILTNTATKLFVAGDSMVDGFSIEGAHYVILNEADALRYSQLNTLLPSFAEPDAFTSLRFENYFTPDMLPDMVFSYAADAKIAVDSSNFVTSWSSYDDTLPMTAAGGAQPTLATEALAPTVLFGDTDDYLTGNLSGVSALASGADATIFICFKPAAVQAGNRTVYQQSNAGSIRLKLFINGNDATLSITNDVAATTTFTLAGCVFVGLWAILVVRKQGATWNLFSYSSGPHYAGSNSGVRAGTITVNMHKFGEAGAATENVNAAYRALIGYNSYLSESQMDQVVRYLQQHWPQF